MVVSTVKDKPLQGRKGSGIMNANSFVRSLFQVSLYKRNQGRITRQVTFAAIAVTVGLGAWRISESQFVTKNDFATSFVFPMLVAAVGAWVGYRLVNWPTFADFLISVEAEMSKVSWPTRSELVRGSVVVLITIGSLAVFLYSFDLLWTFIFKQLRVIN